MPLLLDVNELSAGMHLAADLYHGAKRLFTAEWELSADDVRFLRENHPGASAYVRTPGLDKLVAFEDKSKDEGISRQARELVAEAFADVKKVITAGEPWTEETQKAMKAAITRALTYVQYNPVETAVLTPDVSGDYLTNHTANVFFLALVLGERLREYIKDERQKNSTATISNPKSLGPLAIGAFYHDAGLIEHERLIHRNQRLSATHIARIKGHPEAGCELLPEALPPVARMVLVNHHENYNGSGYPGGLAGKTINVYARILRVADAFVAGTSRRVYRMAKSPAEVLHEMTGGRYRQFYDPQVTEVLRTVIQPFPLGSRLKMSSGETAIVVGYQAGRPFNPRVVIAFDKNGKTASKFSLENPFTLDSRADLKIAACGKDDLSELFVKETPPETASAKVKYSMALDLAYP